jgi:hypothetical protein
LTSYFASFKLAHYGSDYHPTRKTRDLQDAEHAARVLTEERATKMDARWRYTVLLGLLAWQAAAPFGWGQRIGSTLDQRTYTDTASGVPFLFEGDYFVPNTQFLYYSFNATFGSVSPPGPNGVFLTPILLQQTASGPNPGDDAFVVAGVGASQTILYPGPYTFGFDVQNGSDQIPAAGYCFAFINALVDSSGNITATSTGVVDFNVEIDPGTGVSGQGTNAWRFVWPNLPNAIPAGTVFGNGGNYPLNNRSGGFLDDRTYSMYATSK